MQYAIVSDLHANLQAWNAVLLDIRELALDRIVCLGDVVGYGPNPAEVLASVHASVEHIVLGNHDAVVAGKMAPDGFNEKARRLIDWTRTRLNDEAVAFLASLPLTLRAEGFRCAHGEFAQPAAFNYVIDPPDAMASWHTVEEPLLFVGHSHQPGVFILGDSGVPRRIEPTDFTLEPEKRFLVNVGSVGHPRTGQTRATYCIFEPESGSVWWRQIPFDLDAYRAALEDAGIPVETSKFLACDPRAEHAPLREQLNFTPDATGAQAAQQVVEVQEMTRLHRRLWHWQAIAASLVLAFAALTALGFHAWRRSRPDPREILPTESPALTASEFPVDTHVVRLPNTPAALNTPLPGWIIRLGNVRTQGVRVDTDPAGHPELVLMSTSPQLDMEVLSGVIRSSGGDKFCMEALFQRGADFEGSVALVVSLLGTSETGPRSLDQFVVKEPNIPRKDGWVQAKQTFTLPAGTEQLRLRVRGKFSGSVRVRDLSLVRKS